MNRRWIAIVPCLGLSVGVCFAQDKPAAKPDDKKPAAAKPDDKKPAGKPDDKAAGGAPDMSPDMMKAMMPGEHHKHLEPLVGKWDYDLKWWMAPGGEPEAMKGGCETKWIMDGRFLEQMVTGEPQPGPDGKPMSFTGRSYVGYDNFKGCYCLTWFDNMGTGMMVATGSCADGGKTITYTGEYANPMSGNKNEKFRWVTKIQSKDKHVFEMYAPGPDGKEYKQMEITYSRKS